MFDILVASKPRTLETAHHTAMSIALHNVLLSVLLTASVGTAAIFGSAAYDLAWPRAPIVARTPIGTRNPVPVRLGPNDWELGVRYARWLVNGQVDSLAAVMTTDALRRIGGSGGLADRIAQISSEFGHPTGDTYTNRIFSRGDGKPDDYEIFQHEQPFSRLEGTPLIIEWQFDDLGRIRSGEVSPKRRPVLR